MNPDHCPVCGTPWPHPDPSKLLECLEEWYKHPKEEKDAYERMVRESGGTGLKEFPRIFKAFCTYQFEEELKREQERKSS